MYRSEYLKYLVRICTTITDIRIYINYYKFVRRSKLQNNNMNLKPNTLTSIFISGFCNSCNTKIPNRA